MNYDRDILERVLREVESAKIKAEVAAEARRREVYENLPRIAEIDAALRTTVLDIIRASFGKGEDTASLIRKTHEKNAALQAERKKLLESAGIPTDVTEPKYSCDKCNDDGYAGGELCSCVINKYHAAVARDINAELNLKNANFEKFDLSLYPETGGRISPRAQMREIFDICRDYAENFGDDSENLYMSGESGLGKSMLASCIAKTVSERGFSVIMQPAFSILGTYEDVKFGRADVNTANFETCDLLIIDDVGCEMSTPFAVAAFYNLINLRNGTGKKTIVISTLKKAEILKRYGKQTASRLEGDFIKLEFLGNDVRLIK